MRYYTKKIATSVGLGALMLGLVGCSSVSHSKSASLVSGKDMNITKAEFSEHLVKTAQTKDLEDYVLYTLLREKYPVSEPEITAEIEGKNPWLPAFDKRLPDRPMSEKKYRFNTALRLMLEKGVKTNADVSEATLKKYYENWIPDRVVHVIQTDTEEKARKIEDALASGKAPTELEDAKEMKGTIRDIQTISYNNSAVMDEKLRADADSLSKKGDIKGPIKFGQGYIVIQLEDSGKKTNYEKDLPKMKVAYLQSQVTAFNKNKLINELLADKEFDSTSESFEDLFETYLAKDPHAPKSE